MNQQEWIRNGRKAAQFMEALYGKLPEFFRDEDELRTLWSRPDTRRKLLEGLAEKGFGTICSRLRVSGKPVPIQCGARRP